MKTLTITNEKLNQVKNKLDSVSWGFQYSNNYGKDSHKAIEYLDYCTFSLKSIKEVIEEYKEDLNTCYDEMFQDDHYVTVEEEVNYIVSFISSSIAQKRISMYNWSIGETVTFVCEHY